jgi:hypothetical protein
MTLFASLSMAVSEPVAPALIHEEKRAADYAK